MNNKLLVSSAVIAGIILIAASGIYFMEPARSLPHFMPGYNPALSRHHYTHAVGTLVLGLAAFVFVWFQSGKKSGKKENSG